MSKRKQAPAPAGLRYVGERGASVRGIPARDLDGGEIEQLAAAAGVGSDALLAELVASGIYRKRAAAAAAAGADSK